MCATRGIVLARGGRGQRAGGRAGWTRKTRKKDRQWRHARRHTSDLSSHTRTQEYKIELILESPYLRCR
jgi:hypothetical protein